MPTVAQRSAALRQCSEQAQACTRCAALARARTRVVFGAGNPDADLLLVGEAPGREEDRGGQPLLGRAARLLDDLLRGIGLVRDDVFVCNIVRCRPPDNRDPTHGELESCRGWLERTVELVEPRVVCTLGNVATKLLRGDPAAITRVHGRPEVHTIGPRTVRLLPLFHPAAALYQPQSVEVLRADVARLPALLALPLPAQPSLAAPPPRAPGPAGPPGEDPPPAQLTLL